MSIINFGSSISLKQFADSVAFCGEETTIIGCGEPGIGKSSILKLLEKRFPDYAVSYIDCTLLDLGDFALPYTVEMNGIKVTEFAPNARFNLHVGKPVIVMLDEIGKALKPVKNVLLTMINEHRIGDKKLPEGSIVFATTNLASDGVGDVLEAHARNRACVVNIRKPHAGFNADGTIDEDSWGRWAIDNDIAPEVIAWVKQTPDCLASYTDPAQKDNKNIYQPGQPQTAFVTPRSLEKASHIVKQRHILGDEVTISLLAGTIGEPAARAMQAFFTVIDKLATWEAIINDPKGAKLPEDVVARCLTVFSAVARVKDSPTVDKFLDYLGRMEKEWQALFARSIMASTDKQKIAIRSDKFKKWAMDNHWLSA
jgi:hypothetical protein